MASIQPVRGTRDFYPEDMAFRIWLYEKIRLVSEKYGYQEYDGPFLERLDLYAAKSGEELVKEQSYVFPDRGGAMIALRPELTPSLARMVAARGKGLTRPLRWWSFGPFWRYERTQKGRSREFFQWNIDLLGVDSPEADAEIVLIAVDFFRSVGLKANQVGILVNNRQLVERQLGDLDIRDDLLPVTFRLIDRYDRMSKEKWEAYAEDIGLDSSQVEGILVILQNDDAWKESDSLIAFFKAVELMGGSEFVRFDPKVIRGLDYYTGTVYEAVDLSGNFRSIFGGGRYDDLVSLVGGEPLPATGFAMGDMVFSLVLDGYGLLPTIQTNRADVFVPIFNEELMPDSLLIASELRKEGFRTEWYPEPTKLQRQFKYADRQNIPLAVIIGPDEMENDLVTVKDLRDGTQESIARSALVKFLRQKLQA